MISKDCRFRLRFFYYSGNVSKQKWKLTFAKHVHFDIIQIVCAYTLVCARVYFNSVTALKIFLRN